ASQAFGLVTAAAVADPVRSALSQLIDRELELDEVDRYQPPEPTADAVTRAFDAVRARFASADAFQQTLTRTGWDERVLRDTLRQNLRIQSYENQRFPPGDSRRQALIDDWIAGLRRRGNIVDVYLTRR